MNLKYMKVSLFEISYKKKLTFSRHSNLLRCCIFSCGITSVIEIFELVLIEGDLVNLGRKMLASCPFQVANLCFLSIISIPCNTQRLLYLNNL